MDKNLFDYNIVPPDYANDNLDELTREVRAESNIVVSEYDMNLKHFINEKQKKAFNIITEKLYNNKSCAFFVDGPGGTEKTFLYTSLLADIRSKGFFAPATATSGIATSILPGGRTAHSRFKIPIDITEFSTFRISKQSALATLIIEAKLIICDEARMANRVAIEAVNDLLQDLMSTDKLFGGKVVVRRRI